MAAFMDEEEENALLDEILEVLDQVVETSGCRDMWHLWLRDTDRIRRELIRSVPERVTGVPDHLQAFSRSKRSKYGALAAWRHAVLMADALEDDEIDERCGQAVRDIYFTPFPENKPPYSWSKCSSSCPGARCWDSPTVLDLRAAQGCRDSVERLKARVDEDAGQSVADELRRRLLERGTRDTLRDVLRYDTLDRRP